MRTFNVISCVLMVMLAFPAAADLKVGGTRVVLDGGRQKGSIRISNTGESPVVVQSWVDDGDADATPENLRVPLMTTAPLFRLNAGARRDIDVRVAEPGHLPLDRESLFWLNILDVPGRDANGQNAAIEQAVHWRMKVFYRPAGLPGKPEAAIDALQWEIDRSEAGTPLLRARNPSPYFVSLRMVTLNGYMIPLSAVDAAVPPFAQWSHTLDERQPYLPAQPSLQITWIDGEGRLHEWTGRAADGS
ncbi:fimbrial biogenesis chaperone [Stenotrophomonas maltophilia]|uniref:fimbrial biogenesis chaperone n=1 Tax=Stenotrophomonas maltophilia TaxID=40324 RepID=UPI00021E0B13|nr:molecular chaperone [Stenotrophomonas maltophilia]AEM51475.1 Pili assembly chaperone [Stenotrophomonas maltophilia JV3]